MKNTLKKWIWGSQPRMTVLRAALLGLCCFFVFKYAVRPSFLDGASMAPTYRDGELRFINHLAYLAREPDRGDVVAITTGGGDKSFYLKRILGLPGETVAFQEGILLINKQSQPEPYLEAHGLWTMDPVTLGPQEYFVAGDNRMTPRRGHLMGTVHRRNIWGGLLF